MNWYLEVLKKYAVFEGRARRTEYWVFTLVTSVISFILSVIDEQLNLSLLGWIYALVVFLPGLAVTVRRLHDTNRSGWWILISLIPVLGGIVLLIFMLIDSDPMENEYGPNPKYIEG